MKKRLLSALLTFCMVLTLLPVSALAVESDSDLSGQSGESYTLTPADKYYNFEGAEVSAEDAKITLHKQATENQDGTYTIELSVDAKERITTKPTEVVFVIDGSGSMSTCAEPDHDHGYWGNSCSKTNGFSSPNSRWSIAKAAIQTMVEGFDESISYKFVVFGPNNRPITVDNLNDREVDRFLNRNNTTYLSDGVNAGLQQFKDPSSNQVLIIVADGDSNDGYPQSAVNRFDGEVYTVGFTFSNDNFSALATDEEHQLDAQTEEDLELAMDTIAENIKSLITDPLGDKVELVGDVQVAPADKPDASLNNSKDIISWTDPAGLSGKVTLTYTVQIKGEDVVAGINNIPFNDDATLNYSYSTGGAEVDFPDPGISFQAATLDVNYILGDETLKTDHEWVKIKEGAEFGTNIPSVGAPVKIDGSTYYVQAVKGTQPTTPLEAKEYGVNVILDTEQPVTANDGHIHVNLMLDGGPLADGKAIETYLDIARTSDGQTSDEEFSFDDTTDTINFQYEEYNSADVTFTAKGNYVIAGIDTQVVYGENGYTGVKTNDNGSISVDNIKGCPNDDASFKEDGAAEVTVYLRTAYSVEYYLNEMLLDKDPYNDSNTYVAKTSDLKSNTPDVLPEGKGDNGNQTGYPMTYAKSDLKTVLALPVLPDKIAGEITTGWRNNLTDKFDVIFPESECTIGSLVTDPAPWVDANNIIKLYAKTTNFIPTDPTPINGNVEKAPVTDSSVTFITPNGQRETLTQGADYIEVTENDDGNYVAQTNEDSVTVLFKVTVTVSEAGKVKISDSGAEYRGLTTESDEVYLQSVDEQGEIVEVSFGAETGGTAVLYFSKNQALAGTETVQVKNSVVVNPSENPDEDEPIPSDPVDVTKVEDDVTVEKTVTITRNGTPVTGCAQPGDVLTYTITITNNGSEPLTGAKLTDTFNGSGIPYGGNWMPNSDGKQTATGTIKDIPAGASESISYTYTVLAGDAGKELTNTAVVTDSDGDELGRDDTTTEAGYVLTYNATSGGWGTGYATKTQTETKLSATEDILHTLKYQGAEGDGGAPEHADAVRVNENGENEGPFPVVFIGWAASDAFTNDAGQSMNLNSHIFGAGEQFPDIVTEVAIPTVSTVYAVWGYDENGDGTADAQQIVIWPADITVYSGGDGYSSVIGRDEAVEGDESTVEGTSGNGLPTPGFYITLPYDLDSVLKNGHTEGDGDLLNGAIDLSDILSFSYKYETEERTWTLSRYDLSGESQALSDGIQRFIYRLNDDSVTNTPIRLQFKDENGNLTTSDDFDISLSNLNQTYSMTIYAGALEQNRITADILGIGETYSICVGDGLLTVRGLNDYDSTNPDSNPVKTIQSSEPSTADGIQAHADGEVTYYINDSNLEVADGTKVMLLVDSIVPDGTSDLKEKAVEAVTLITADHQFEYQYLDLVDTSNGNAYVTLKDSGDAINIYWEVPENADTSKPIYIVHYDGLDRNFENLDDVLGSVKLTVYYYIPEGSAVSKPVNTDNVTYVEMEAPSENNGNLVFQTSSFSPFAVVYEAEEPVVQYTITATAGPNGSISPSGNVTVNAGGSRTFTFNANSGYHIDTVTVDGRVISVSGSSYTFSNVQANHTIHVTFAENSGDSKPSDHDYYVYYYRNYGATSARNEGYDSGERVTIRDNDWWDRDGYVFEGWNTEPDGSGRDYEPGDEFNIHSDLRLYAQWSRSSDGDGGDGPQLNKDEHIAYVSGTPEGLVKPEDFITREEVATIFFRLLTDESRAEYITEYNPYPDLSPDRWSYYSITTMTNGELMLGRPGGVFEPSAYITRGEFAVVAAQFSNAQYSGPDLFSDISDHWARDYINRAANEGWIAGYPDGSFGPDDYITRAQVMALVNEVLDRAPDADYMLDDMIVWPDNPEGAWYYEDVQEATNSHSYEWRNTQHTSEEWEDFIPMKPFNELVREAFNASR